MIRNYRMAALPVVLLNLFVMLSLMILTTGCGDDETTPTTPTSAALAVTNINPNTGTTNGGTMVTFTGTGFVNSTVTFGGTSATNVTITSTTSFTAMTPAHAAGAVDVVVTNSDGDSDTTTNGYTYVAPITLEKTNWTVDLTYLGGSFRVGADLIQNGNALTGDKFYSSGGTNFDVLTVGMVFGDSIDVTFTLDSGQVNEASFRCIGALFGSGPQTFRGDFTELIGDGFICGGTTPCVGLFEFR